MPNPYLSEKLAQAHHENLLREAEQQRRVAQVSEPGVSGTPLLRDSCRSREREASGCSL